MPKDWFRSTCGLNASIVIKGETVCELANQRYGRRMLFICMPAPVRDSY